MEKICVIGLGYIGLPTASFLATKGHDVHGVDISEPVVKALNCGKILIKEPALDILVKSAVGSGKLHASITPDFADIFILSLPTPFKDDKQPDLSFVRCGVESIAPYLAPGNCVILESTSPVGTTEMICSWLHELRPDLSLPGYPHEHIEQIYLAHCPERVLPGRILVELVHNDRIVGGIDQPSTEKIAQFYESFVQGTVYKTSAKLAELSKLIENCYRDVNIAFANELSLVCSKLGLNVWEAIHLANRHPRVNILSPSVGVGGHCISVDPWFLIYNAPKETRLIHTARMVNDSKPDYVLKLIYTKAKRFSSPVIACMGLTFKPDVDDLRESPALKIVSKLASNNSAQLLVVEPNINDLPEKLQNFSNIKKCDMEEAVQASDMVVIMVKHKEFCALRQNALQDVLLGKVIIDACGIFQNIPD